MRTDLLAMASAFFLATVAAELLGATNLGTALTFGVLAFALVLVWSIVRRP